MRTLDAFSIVQEVYNECSKIFPNGIHDAYLYGSYARGTHDSESDVDILLTIDADAAELTNYRRALADLTSRLSLKHDVTVSVTAKPLQQFRQYSSVVPFYKNVLSEGIRYAV